LYTNHNSDLGEWLIQVKPILRKEENLLLKFLRVTGLRASEGVASFNLIIEYAKKGKLNEYLTETGVLEHFRFKETFIRGTKNCFISVIAQDLISEIVESEPVSYFAIIKRLQRNGLKSRIGELRDFFGTFMLSHGLIREEIDLLQGRVGKSIFARFYWSPSFIELQGCLLKASAEMESKNGA
jgi:intergrase/recombinase